MSDRNCKSCTMIIPSGAKTCPYCGTNQGRRVEKKVWTLQKTIFVLLLCLLGAALRGVIKLPLQDKNTPQQAISPQAFSTNNQRNGSSSSPSFLRSGTPFGRETWAKGNVRWHLELTPKDISGTNIFNHKSDKTESFNPKEEWKEEKIYHDIAVRIMRNLHKVH